MDIDNQRRRSSQDQKKSHDYLYSPLLAPIGNSDQQIDAKLMSSMATGELTELLTSLDTMAFISTVQQLRAHPQQLTTLASLFPDIEKQRDFTEEERCRYGFVLLNQLTTFIDTTSETNFALDPFDKKNSRTILHVIGTAALIDEIAYAVFQFSVTFQGLISLGLNYTAALLIALLLTTGDFISNITNVSPANDANSILFSTHQPLKNPWLQRAFHVINAISIAGSYFPGATPGCVALIQYLPIDMEVASFALTVAVIGALTILPGVVYYLGFNMEGLHDSFQAFEQWLAMPKKDGSILRILETLKKIIGITVYRALCFAFFSQTFLQALRINDSNLATISFILSGLTFIATAINVITARIMPTLAETLNSHFVHVRPDDIEQSRLTYSNFTPTMLAAMLINLTIASGYGVMLHAYTQTSVHVAVQYLPPGLLTLAIAANSLYVQRTVAIYSHALESISSSDLTSRLEKLTTNAAKVDENDLLLFQEETGNAGLYADTTSVVTAELLKQQRLNTTRANFAWLASTFKSARLTHMAGTVSAVGRLARIAGFFYFVQRLNAVFSLGLSEQMLIGLCLAFAPDNLKNEWLLFKKGSADMFTQKSAEAFVAFCADSQKHPDISFTGWCYSHLLDLISIYNKAFLACDLQADLMPAMKNRIIALAPPEVAPNQSWSKLLGTIHDWPYLIELQSNIPITPKFEASSEFLL